MSKAWQKVSYTDLRLNEIFWPHHQNRCFCWYWLSKISLNEMLVFIFNWFLLLCDVLQILAIQCFEWVSSRQIDSLQYYARRGCVNPGLRHLPQRAPFLLHSRGSAASAPTPPVCTVQSLLLICNPLPLQLVICKYFGCVIEYFHPREKRALVIV